MVQGTILFGSSGAVTSITGNGIASVTKLATGVYDIKLTDSYPRMLAALTALNAPPTGSNVAAASLVAGTLYQITAVGTTNFNAVGLASNLVAAVGQVFVASGAGSGTGTAKTVGETGVFNIEVSGDPQSMINPVTKGGHIVLRINNASDAPVSPASGSQLEIALLLRNSSIKGSGE